MEGGGWTSEGREGEVDRMAIFDSHRLHNQLQLGRERRRTTIEGEGHPSGFELCLSTNRRTKSDYLVSPMTLLVSVQFFRIFVNTGIPFFL